jgi:hypothetical protein
VLHTPHRDSGSSRYCGPTAIMSVTGLRGSIVRDAVRQLRGDIRSAAGSHMPVTGMSNKDLLGAMSLLGWHVVEEWSEPDNELRLVDDPKGNWIAPGGVRQRYKRPEGFKPLPFADFLAERGADGPFIVNVTGHYMAVSHGEVCDAASTVLPTEIERYLKRGKFGYRQSWVRKWWKFAQ